VNDTLNVTADTDETNTAAAGITLGNITLSSGVGAGSTTFNPTSAKLTLGPVTTSTNSAKTLVLDGTNSGNSITGAISNGSNVVSVTKSNSSMWTLSATSTYTGTTTIGTNNGGGVLRATATNALGSGVIQFDGSGGNPGPTSRLELSGNISLVNPTINLQQRNNPSPAIESVSGNNTLIGTINVGSGGTFAIVQSDAGLLTLSGGISAASSTRTITFQGAGNGLASGVISNGAGALNVAKDGAGIWSLSNNNTYTGTTTVSAGTLFVNGTSGTGLTTVASGAKIGGSGTIAGGLSASGEVSPGNSAGTLSVTGNATLAAGSTLTMELGGAASASPYDHFNVSGQFAPSGNLNVVLINGFLPNTGDTFDLLNWGSRTSSFTNVNLPAVPGLIWNTSNLYVDGSISVTLTGDFNGDTTVNAADYVTWRMTDGSSTGYNSWRTNFNASAASGPDFSDLTGVPEPKGILLLLVAFAATTISIRPLRSATTSSGSQHK
jgi:autotransporter-associated beta strand protein